MFHLLLTLQVPNRGHSFQENPVKKKSNWYSLTSPCGHLYNTDTSLLRTVCLIPEMPKLIPSLPLQYGELCKADTWFSHFGVRI